MIIQKQTWSRYARFLFVHTHGSVQLETSREREWYGGSAFIYALWVNESYRRQSIATSLISLAENMAKDEGHESVSLIWDPADTSEEILNWYLRRGYKQKRRLLDERILLTKYLK